MTKGLKKMLNNHRIQLFPAIAKALAENWLTRLIRKKALQNNWDKICNTLTFSIHIKEMDFLKVA